jgi:O-antigen ligase
VNGAVGLEQLLTGTQRAAGLTIHPNYLALGCAIAVPTALLWVSRGGRWRLAGLVAVALLLGGEYASGSRSGGVGAVLAVVVTVAALPRLRRGFGFTLPIAGIAVVAVLAFTSAGQSVLAQLRLGGGVKTQISTNSSDTSRAQLHSVALRQFDSHPVQGIGFAVIEDAHNIYYQLLASGGVIAAISFLIFAGGVLDSALRARAGPQRDTAWALAIAFVVWLANGPFTAQLGDKYLYVVPGLLLATSYVAQTVGARGPEAGSAEIDRPRAWASAPAR